MEEKYHNVFSVRLIKCISEQGIISQWSVFLFATNLVCSNFICARGDFAYKGLSRLTKGENPYFTFYLSRQGTRIVISKCNIPCEYTAKESPSTCRGKDYPLSKKGRPIDLHNVKHRCGAPYWTTFEERPIDGASLQRRNRQWVKGGTVSNMYPVSQHWRRIF